MQVEYINHGIGFRVGNKIYLNRKLKNYQTLHDAVLEHEKKHTGKSNIKDIKLDIKNKEIKNQKGPYYKFMLRHPSSLTTLIPLIKIKGKWTLDKGIGFIWIFAIFMGGLIWRLI